jgi:spermidine synthase
MGIRRWISALTYDRMIAKTESAGLAAHRAGLLEAVTGRVLEIGGGTGGNLVHYRPGVETLTVTEPEPAMLNRLRRRVEEVVEHLRAEDERVARMQDRMNWFNRLVVCCDCNRPTLDTLCSAGFVIGQVVRTELAGAPAFARPLAVGSALNAA